MAGKLGQESLRYLRTQQDHPVFNRQLKARTYQHSQRPVGGCMRLSRSFVHRSAVSSQVGEDARLAPDDDRVAADGRDQVHHVVDLGTELGLKRKPH